MIKRMKLKNIQSHKETEIEFSKGINAIVGSSNNGKTTILRGLNWCRFNRPLGVDILVSHWNMNDKGAIQDESYVEVENDNNVITRRRTKNDNQYIINNKKLDVVKTDIPIEVINAFNLSETNFQNQQDAPFLLSQTNGEVAKYFNKIVKLDIIDKVLTNAETSRRRTNSEIDRLEKNLKNSEEKLNKFDFLENLQKQIEEFKKIDNNANNLNNEICLLKNDISEIEILQNKIYDFIRQKKLCNEIDSVHIEGLKNDILNLKDDIDIVENRKVYDLSVQNRFVNKLDILNNNIVDLKNDIADLKNEIELYNYCICNANSFSEEINELKKQLPDICPVCGSKISKNCL